MSVDYYLFEMLTGQRLTPLPVSKGPWSLKTNADESISCTVPARSAIAAKLRVWEASTLARNGLLVVVDNVPIAAGPIWKRSYKQGGDIELVAGGLRSYWERRLLLPVAARTIPLVDANGDPVTSLDFAASNLSPGTIAKRYIELVTLWPDGNIPLVLPADEAGTASDTVAAIDLKTVRKLLDNLTQRQNGPDIAFPPRWSGDGLGIYWEMQTGTNANPRLGNTDASLISWTIGAAKGGAFELEVSEDGTGLASEVFGMGGGSVDRAIASRSFNPTLTDDGFPLLQAADTGHSDVRLQATMQEYTDQRANLGQYASSFWSMKVRAHEKGTPRLGTGYWVGDMATLIVDPAEPVIPAGPYQRRIASISGDANGEEYSIVFAEDVA